jgi:hypothetical protein
MIMLRFPSRPDRVFLEIFHDALEGRRDEIAQFIEEGSGQNEWRNWLPILAPFYSPCAAVNMIDRLLAASKEDRLYHLTDYHWLLIYSCLHAFCDIHNDLRANTQDGMLEVGPYRIGEIDFDEIVEKFFWDTDFLAGDTLLNLTVEQREQMAFSAEAFSIAAALPPHPEELEIRRCDGDLEWDQVEDPCPASGTISIYPPES